MTQSNANPSLERRTLLEDLLFEVLLEIEKNQKRKRLFRFPWIFRFLLLCRTDVLVIVSRSVFDAKNGGEVRFTLCGVVDEGLLNWKGMGQRRDANEMPANGNKQTRLGIVVVFCRRPAVNDIWFLW